MKETREEDEEMEAGWGRRSETPQCMTDTVSLNPSPPEILHTAHGGSSISCSLQGLREGNGSKANTEQHLG